MKIMHEKYAVAPNISYLLKCWIHFLQIFQKTHCLEWDKNNVLKISCRQLCFFVLLEMILAKPMPYVHESD